MYVEYVPDCLGIDVSKPQCWLDFLFISLRATQKCKILLSTSIPIIKAIDNIWSCAQSWIHFYLIIPLSFGPNQNSSECVVAPNLDP